MKKRIKMEKLLVISKDELMRATTERVLGSSDLQVIVSDHQEALEKFLNEEPAFVLVLDYEERGDFPGVRTYKDIKSSATTERVFRCGFGKYSHKDYIQMPFLIEDVIKKFK